MKLVAEKRWSKTAFVPERTPDVFHVMAQQVSPQRDTGRVGSREVNLIVRTNGTMVSQHGPCVCGKPKREWHDICLKGDLHG